MTMRAQWATVLAGGDGQRLRPFTRLLTGDDRPKQFCALFGGRTLLGETRARIGLQVEAGHTLYVLNRLHEPLYSQELRDVAPDRLVEQPANRGTTAAIAYALIRQQRLAPNAIVGFFPADHFYRDVLAFQRTLALSYAVAELRPDRVFLVGAEADAPETDYGWIEPGEPLHHRAAGPISVRDVVGFHEKPSSQRAEDLFARRCLFNTFVMVGTRQAFEQLFHTALPGYLSDWAPVLAARSEVEEFDAASSLYASLRASDFSRDVLARQPQRLGVITLAGGWTDLGQPARVHELLTHRSTPVQRLQTRAS